MLRVGQIFKSISGEVGIFPQGTLCTFLRVSGCNLNCSWCDTKKFINPNSGELVPDPVVVLRLKDTGLSNFVITGGEPLLQEWHLYSIIKTLYKNPDTKFSIETNGAVKIPEFNDLRARLGWVIDIKMPSSGCYNPNWEDNLPFYLSSKDWMKIVIRDDLDYEKAVEAVNIIKERQANVSIAFSPLMPQMQPKTLFHMMMKDKLYDVVMNLQLHKCANLP